MPVPTREELDQEIDEAKAARINREQKQSARDAANAAATFAQAELDEAMTNEAVQKLQAEQRLQEFITGQETPIVPPPILPPPTLP